VTFTASDVIAVVAIVVGPLVGLITGLKLQERKATADLEIARRARVQANRAAHYVDMLEQLFRTQDYVDRTEPMMMMAGDPGPPAFPSDDEIRKLNARTAAFGSPPMQELLTNHRRLVKAWQISVWQLRDMKQTGMGKSLTDAHLDMEAKRAAVRESFDAVMERANKELAE